MANGLAADNTTGGIAEAVEFLRRVNIDLDEPTNWREFLAALDAATATASAKGGAGQGDGNDALNFTVGKGGADLSHDSYGRRLDSNGIPMSRPTRGECEAMREQQRLARKYSTGRT